MLTAVDDICELHHTEVTEGLIGRQLGGGEKDRWRGGGVPLGQKG